MTRALPHLLTCYLANRPFPPHTLIFAEEKPRKRRDVNYFESDQESGEE